ncbi:type 1 glutamine amidotransferase [Pedobacter immunditicola]|uniref:type 1 glutamine amidotransferase n=1 Tax=Pedobacter immunditicola TaxID=3133440 RepID=UPI0030B35815
MTEERKIKIAVIDMNDGAPNQGMGGILSILDQYQEEMGLHLSTDIFDLRQKNELPDTGYDVYISSGGPGSPFDGVGQQWEMNFFKLLDDIDTYNQSGAGPKKYVFLICHSFQMACRKYGLGTVSRRKSPAFGIFPISMTAEGIQDPVFKGLPNPFYAVDSRDWQVIYGEENDFEDHIAEVAAIEKYRPHVDRERCIMSIRFSKEVMGTQFHPEADPLGMKTYLLKEDRKASIIEDHGEEKYLDMLNSLDDPERISLTKKLILPNFLNEAIQQQIEA